MTPGGEVMLRVRERVAVGAAGEVQWRKRRADSLARMLAWRRIVLNPAGRAHLRRVIAEDILPDLGEWPRRPWLKRRVRAIESDIRSGLLAFDEGRL